MQGNDHLIVTTCSASVEVTMVGGQQ